MKRVPILFLLGLFVGIRVTTTDNDNSLFFQNNEKGEIFLSSFNSAQQIRITKCYTTDDTLFVNYKRGAFLRPNNVLPLDSNTKYLKCANNKYLIKKEGQKFLLFKVLEGGKIDEMDALL